MAADDTRRDREFQPARCCAARGSVARREMRQNPPFLILGFSIECPCDTIVRMRARDLLNKLHVEPFQPFRVRLPNDSSIDVLDPNTVVVGPSSAIMPIETMRDGSAGYYIVARWRTGALAHMVEFIDIDPPKNRSTRKRAS